MSFYCHNVVDGDTFDVAPKWTHSGRTGSRVRVANVNAPELNQYGGHAAKERLTSAVLGKHVDLYGRSIGYGRLVAAVYVNGVDVAQLV